MERREFLRRTLGAGLATGLLLPFTRLNVFAETVTDDEVPYDLVAVRDGEPAEMYHRAIDAMGGISRYVSKGQDVVVKPNIAWDVKPELAANTNPELVNEIVKSCLEAGADSVRVFDHPCDNWKKTYSTSGIADAVEEAGGTMIPGSSEKYFAEVDFPDGKKLTSGKVHEQILESDVFINVPVLKNHGGAKLTIAMKNLMGTVWDRGYLHSNGLHQCIADLSTRIQPDLNIVDAYRVMKKGGPRGGSPDYLQKKKFLIISDDIVAADTAAAQVFGSEPGGIPHIKHGHEMELGNMQLEEQNIARIKV
ncbi:MAG: DUF362 domain-containing protein [Planctomycetota bacterium]